MKLSDFEGVRTNAKTLLESPEKTFPAVFQGITNGRYEFTDKKGNPHYLVPMMVGDFKNHLRTPGQKVKLVYRQVSPSYGDYAVASVMYENKKLKEGFTDSELQGILDKHEDAYMRFKQGEDFYADAQMQAFMDDLFSYYSDSGEMPYGVMKARTGDPDQWIADRLDQHDMDTPVKHEDMTTEAPDIVNRVWGTDKATSFKDKWDKLTSMDWLFGDYGHKEDTPRFNAEYTKERLKRSGFNDDQINQIRDMVTQAMKAAIQWGQRRFGLSPNQFRSSPETFAVYGPRYWDQIKPEQLIQINKMARQLLARKLDKGGFGEAAVGAPNPGSQNNASGDDDEHAGDDERFARNLERVLGKQLDKAQPTEIKTAKQKLDAMRTEGKNMKDKKALREDTSINNMTINMDVQAHGPEDSLELLRKLSGLPVQAPMAAPMPGAPVPGAGIPGNEPVTPAGASDAAMGMEPAPDAGMDAGAPQDFVDLSPFDSMPDDSDMDGDLEEPAVQDMGPDMEPDVNVEPDMDGGMEPEMGIEPQEAFGEAEEDRMFNNSPHEETFKADAQIKQGTDLNRPKQMFKKEYPGDNPMAVKETKELSETLYKRYIMSVVESLTETPVADEEDRKVRCGELGRLKQDQHAMQDPATRAAVLKKWQELRCGG